MVLVIPTRSYHVVQFEQHFSFILLLAPVFAVNLFRLAHRDHVVPCYLRFSGHFAVASAFSWRYFFTGPVWRYDFQSKITAMLPDSVRRSIVRASRYCFIPARSRLLMTSVG